MSDTGINIMTILIIVQIITQVLLTIVLIIITAFYRRDTKRATLVSLMSMLSSLKKEAAENVLSYLAFCDSLDVKEGSEEIRKKVSEDLQMSRERLDALSKFYNEALKEIDNEWNLKGVLYQSLGKK